MQGMVDGRDADRVAARRRRSAWVSLSAGVIMLALLLWGSPSLDGGSGLAWSLWIGAGPLVVSIMAAAQYRYSRHTGAGAAAMAIDWSFTVLLFTRAGTPFLVGALLQTYAWWISRPGAHPSPDAGEDG